MNVTLYYFDLIFLLGYFHYEGCRYSRVELFRSRIYTTAALIYHGICRNALKRAGQIKFNCVASFILCSEEEEEEKEEQKQIKGHRRHFCQAYVREQILSTVAVILKRSALDKDPTRFNAYRSQLFEKMSHLLKHSDEAMQIIGCSILTNLLNEFSSNSRASALGVAWESHTEAKEAFEKEDMKEILTLILQMLHQMDESRCYFNVLPLCNTIYADFLL